MTDFAIIRHSKLKSLGEIGGSLSHTYRTRLTPNADLNRAHLNENDFETPEQVIEAIKARMPEKIRKDNVLCVEYLITASPEWTGFGTGSEQQFFDDAREYLKEKYGADNVISTHIHRDETTPHLVAYIVPLDEKTGKLNCKKWLGGKAKCSQQQTEFANRVGYLGLERGIEGSKAEHVSIKKYYATVENTLDKTVDLDNLDNLPEPGFFESKKDYAKRVLNEVLPDYETAVFKANQVDAHKRELHMLREKVKDAEPYFNALEDIANYPISYKARLDEALESVVGVLHNRNEIEQKQITEKVEGLTNTFNEFTDCVNTYKTEWDNTVCDLKQDLADTKKWLKKQKTSEKDYEEYRSHRRKLGVADEAPSFYMTESAYDSFCQDAERVYKKKVAQEAKEKDIASVVSSLKTYATEPKVVTSLKWFDKEIQPVINEVELIAKKQDAANKAFEKKQKKIEGVQATREKDIEKGNEEYRNSFIAARERNNTVLAPSPSIDQDKDIDDSYRPGM